MTRCRSNQHFPDSFHPIPLLVVSVALLWSTILLYAGGFTTSIGAGMAFLDWPLSNGSLNPEGWTRELDQFAEHSHRLAGKVIGLLSIAVAVSFTLFDRRPALRKLAWFLVGLVVAQGVLGGLRVLLDEQNIQVSSNWIAQTFAVAHALGAQAVVLTLTTLLVTTLPLWWSNSPLWERPGGKGAFYSASALIVLGAITILAGAITRHTFAGLAIPTFPAAAADGSWLPAHWSFPVAIHFIHRTLGLILALAVILFSLHLLRLRPAKPHILALTLLPVVLTGLQIWLGILILQTLRNPHVATLHMLNGALLLASLHALACLLWPRPGIPSTGANQPAV